MRAISQEEVLAAAIGNPEYYMVCTSSSSAARRSRPRPAPNAPSASRLAKAKKLLKESGYKGEKIVILQPTDIPISNAFALVSARPDATSA